jgi:hypothetical protein
MCKQHMWSFSSTVKLFGLLKLIVSDSFEIADCLEVCGSAINADCTLNWYVDYMHCRSHLGTSSMSWAVEN